MIIEQEICRRVAEVLQGLLPEAEVNGNWLPDPGGLPKGAGGWPGAKLTVSVGARAYPDYTAATATFAVSLEGEFPFAEDADLEKSVAAYGEIAARLEEWHADISAVKRDLTVDGGFGPTGLKLSGGDFDPDREAGKRYYSQSFELRGRIVKRSLGGLDV